MPGPKFLLNILEKGIEVVSCSSLIPNCDFPETLCLGSTEQAAGDLIRWKMKDQPATRLLFPWPTPSFIRCSTVHYAKFKRCKTMKTHTTDIHIPHPPKLFQESSSLQPAPPQRPETVAVCHESHQCLVCPDSLYITTENWVLPAFRFVFFFALI